MIKRFSAAAGIMLAAFLVLGAQNAFAQDTPKALGELLAGRGVSIDDSAANPG